MKNLFLIKEIKSKEGELHFRRWRLIETPWFSVYIHGIYKKDEDQHLHDHPWDYISIPLYGMFIEQTENDVNIVSPFAFIKRKAESFHKIYRLQSKKVFTLFITGKRRRQWGYNVDGKWIDNETYRKMKHWSEFSNLDV